jgi:hypothetical protein
MRPSTELLTPRSDSDNDDYSSSSGGNSEEVVEEVQLKLDDDIHNGVLTASFNGVDMSLQNGLESVKVHPLFVWIASSFLLIIQFLLVLSVMLEVDQVSFLTGHHHENNTKTTLKFERFIKMILVMIVQVNLLKELRQSLDTLLWILSPETWRRRLDYNHPSKFKVFFENRWMRLPFAVISFLAIFGKLGVAYLISQTSISVIFASLTLTEAIFNSLALTFIIDLDEFFWSVLELNFNMSFTDNFSFRLSGKKARKQYRTKGCSALRTRRAAVTIMLSLFYSRQVVSVLITVERKVLPSTLQLCDMWTLIDHPDVIPAPFSWAHLPVSLMLQPVEDKLREVATGNSSVDEARTPIVCNGTGPIGWERTQRSTNITHDNLRGVLKGDNSTGVCHCEALEGIFHPSFWVRSLPGLVRDHVPLAVGGFTCSFFLVVFPLLLDVGVQRHEEMQLQKKQVIPHDD